MFPCIFCDAVFKNCTQLGIHLVGQHVEEGVSVDGGPEFKFRVYATRKGTNATCICGSNFTCRQEAARNDPELWTPVVPDTNSLTAHLKREGGLHAHLQKLREQALLDKIAEAGKPQRMMGFDPASGKDWSAIVESDTCGQTIVDAIVRPPP